MSAEKLHGFNLLTGETYMFSRIHDLKNTFNSIISQYEVASGTIPFARNGQVAIKFNNLDTVSIDEKQRDTVPPDEVNQASLLALESAAFTFLYEVFGKDADTMFLAVLLLYDEANIPFLVMELSTGNLNDLYDTRSDRYLTSKEASASYQEKCAIIFKVGSILHQCHQQEIVIGDVKPGNILVLDSGEPVFSDPDFEYIRSGLGVKQGKQLLTFDFSPLGAVTKEKDQRFTTLSLDIYGYIAIIWELLTGSQINYKELVESNDIEQKRQYIISILEYNRNIHSEKYEELASFFLTYFDQQHFRQIDAVFKENISVDAIPDQLNAQKVAERFFAILK